MSEKELKLHAMIKEFDVSIRSSLPNGSDPVTGADLQKLVSGISYMLDTLVSSLSSD